ncbi:RNA polymerase sigma factor (sigma-70 family) [Nakamurella sp. UYEF19]|uniref:sigma-70 family RNA polymerase sigma factor n=1 Tax=Nakamurella sp. UYEF19 TaxID=1756392 RepID=UPI0033922237
MEFETFVAAELAGLTRFAGVLTGDRQTAHDVLIDALLIASRRWIEIGAMKRPSAYVRRIVVTTFLAERRKVMRRNTKPCDDSELLDRTEGDRTGQVETRQVLDDLLRLLPRQQRTAVVLRYYLDYDDAGIAEAMSISASGVRSNISRALATLRLTPDVLELEKDH